MYGFNLFFFVWKGYKSGNNPDAFFRKIIEKEFASTIGENSICGRNSKQSNTYEMHVT